MATGREKQIIDERIKKIEALKKEGVNPYTYHFDKQHSGKELQETYRKLDNEEASKDKVIFAGRLMTKRVMGKIAFGTVQDGSGKMQILLQKGETPEEFFDLFKKIDSGDFIGVEGNPLRTKRGELSILTKKLTLLTKSIKPLPEKWHGIKDKEERYRKRYLDLVMNPEVMEDFVKRQKIIDCMREFLVKKDYLEVQTPVLQPIYGGGSARPFESRLNALNIPIYMRISNEMYLKRLIVGGFEKVFEFSTDFRNEGIDRSHNPEFTILEAMTAYEDYTDGMKLVEELTAYVVKTITGGTKISYQGKEIDFKTPWKRMSVRDSLKEYANMDIESASDEDLKKALKKHGLETLGDFDRGNAIMALVEEFCEPKFIQPTILYDYPLETSPLAKKKRDDERYVERFEQFVNGFEVGNNYSEITDPNFLRKNWKHQEEMLGSGDEEAQRTDEDYLNALEVGMPPTSGISVSIDRMAMLINDKSSIRDVIFFPFMKPEGMKEAGKAKKTMLASVVINKGSKMEKWQEMNTVAHLNASFASREGKSLLFKDHVETKEGERIKLNIQHAIMIKEANSNKELLALLDAAKKKELEIFEFTREMMETTDDEKISKITKGKKKKDLEFLGVLIYGEKSTVEKLTKEFELIR